MYSVRMLESGSGDYCSKEERVTKYCDSNCNTVWVLKTKSFFCISVTHWKISFFMKTILRQFCRKLRIRSMVTLFWMLGDMWSRKEIFTAIFEKILSLVSNKRSNFFGRIILKLIPSSLWIFRNPRKWLFPTGMRIKQWRLLYL